MEMEVPSSLTLEPSNGFDSLATKGVLPLWQLNLSDQMVWAQGALDVDYEQEI